MSTPPPAAAHRWTFQRLGGLDQPLLQSAGDFAHLRELDPKLWVALSCPASGLEFDARTLALLDTDGDGRIRIPEILAAVEWTLARLRDPARLALPDDTLPLDAINADTAEGQRLAATARAVLRFRGTPDAGRVSPDDVARCRANASEQVFNGDGVLPPHPSFDADVRRFIEAALAVVGGVRDAGGKPGVNLAIAEAFMRTLADWQAWRRSVHEAAEPLGHDTPEAWELLTALRGKVDDYFLRCELAAYDPAFDPAHAARPGGPPPAEAAQNDHGQLAVDALADRPLARVEPNRPLDPARGVNPAWRVRLERFIQLTAPLRPEGGPLDRAGWDALVARFAKYENALAHRPAPVTVTVDDPPTQSPESLGEDTLAAWLSGAAFTAFKELARQDAAVPASAADLAELERLVLYDRHLHRLLENFVSFREFYAMQRAVFRFGTLYIDGRACDLCMTVDKVDDHAALAQRGQLFLLYGQCTRAPRPGAPAGEASRSMSIVAAVTSGDSDLLLPGRNGVFIDNRGDDWDVRVVKVVSNPISLWQAAWSPYKKFGHLVTEQLNKFASDRQTGLMDAASAKLGTLGQTPAPAAPPASSAPSARFDIGRNVGILAAVGLALGSIGGALATMAAQVVRLAWWQIPLLALTVLAAISGPSILIAWLKLRQRTLGPLLEASGWAVNGRVAVTGKLAARLTTTAALPPHAKRRFGDPWVVKRRWTWIVWTTVAAVAAGVVLGATGWGHRLWPFGARSEASAPAPETAASGPTTPETVKSEAMVPEETTPEEAEIAAPPGTNGG